MATFPFPNPFLTNTLGPTIYAALGYDTLYQLIFQCGWISVGIIGNLIGALIMDWTGRKPLLILGVSGCCVALILEAAMVSSFAEAATNKAGLRMGVAAAYLFLLVYSIGIDVAGVVFYSELFPNHLRAKGLALSIGVIALTDLVYLQVAATVRDPPSLDPFPIKPNLNRPFPTLDGNSIWSSSSYPALGPSLFGGSYPRRKTFLWRRWRNSLEMRLPSMPKTCTSTIAHMN
jgi:MFS family permease